MDEVSVRWVRAFFGGAAMIGALVLVHRAVFTVAAHDYVLALASTAAGVALARAAVALLAPEAAE